MDRAGKLGYGFCFLGIGAPYLIEKYRGRDIAFTAAVVFVVIGFGFLIAGHLHETKSKADSVAAPSESSSSFGCLGLILFCAFFRACFSPHGQRLLHQAHEWLQRMWN